RARRLAEKKKDRQPQSFFFFPCFSLRLSALLGDSAFNSALRTSLGRFTEAPLQPAPRADFAFDGIAHLARAAQLFLVITGKRGRVWKAPVQTFRPAGEDRTALGACLVTNCHHVVEAPSAREHLGHAFRSVFGNVYASFPHCLDDDG